MVSKRLLVGLTGALGAGKSTVANVLRQRGALVINADALGHKLLANNDVKQELAGAFGFRILDNRGSINRRALAEAAFASGAAVNTLNRITAPPLLKLIAYTVEKAPANALVVIDAALILEWRAALAIDIIVVVDAPESARKRWTQEKYDADAFDRREQAQLPADKKRAAADIIILNDGDGDSLLFKGTTLYDILIRIKNGNDISTKPLII